MEAFGGVNCPPTRIQLGTDESLTRKGAPSLAR